MNKKRNTALPVVLAAAAMICIAFLVIGLSIWAEHKKDSPEETDRSTDSFTAEDVVKLTDGEVMDYENLGCLKLGEYSGIEVDTEPTSGDILVEMEDVLLKMTKKQKGKIEEGDYVRIDYTGYIDGEEYEELSEEDAILCVGELDYGEGLEESLVGRQPGDRYSVSVTYDDMYEELDGEMVDFEVVVKGRFNDYYANKFSKGEYPTTEQYIEAVKEVLRQENGEPEMAGEMAWSTILEDSDVISYPAGAVEEELEITKSQYEEFAELQGISYEEMLEGFGMDEDALEEIAEETVMERMIAKTIAAKENLVMDDDTYKAYLMSIMEYEDDSDLTLDELVQEYEEGYGVHPGDDMLIEFVKTFIGGKVQLV